MDDRQFNISSIVLVLMVGVFGIGGCMLGLPNYDVWHQSKAGEAELARAEYNRQIATLEARQKLESAKSLADAEVIRAEGVAKANQIIGKSLQGNESYLRYLWVQGMQTNQMQVVYIPTECNLPILEANRFKEYEKNK
jgi:hypothetical protein